MSKNVLHNFLLPFSSPGHGVKLRSIMWPNHITLFHPCEIESELIVVRTRIVWGCSDQNQVDRLQKQITEPKAVSRTEEPEEVCGAAVNLSNPRKMAQTACSSEVKPEDWILVPWFMSALKLRPTWFDWRQCDCFWKQVVNAIQIGSEIVFKATFNSWYFQKCQLALFEGLLTKARSKSSYN